MKKSVIEFVLVLLGKVSVSGVILLAGILVARFGGPAEYGLFSVAIAAVLLCDGMIGAPLDMAAIRFSALHAGETSRTQRFEAMALHLKLIATAVCFLGALIWRKGTFPLLPCLFATAFLLMAWSVATGLQIRHRFKTYSFVDMAQGLVRLAGFALLAILHLAKAGLSLFVYGLAAAATAVFGVTRLGQKYLLGPWPPRPDAARMLRYCGYAAGIIACGTFTGRGDLLLLAATHGAGNEHAYGLASQMAMLLGQIALYAGVLTQPRVIRLAREGGLRRLFLANFVLTLGVAALAFGAFQTGLVGLTITKLVGHGFDRSLPLLQILAIGAVLDLLIVPVLMGFGMQTCPAQAFWGEVIVAGVFLLAGVAAARGSFSGPPEVAMAWIAVLARLAKLILYGGLFIVKTAPAAVAGLASPPVAPRYSVATQN